MFAFCILHFTGISTHNSQNRPSEAERISLSKELFSWQKMSKDNAKLQQKQHTNTNIFIYISIYIYNIHKTMVQCYIGNRMLEGKTYYPQSLFCDRAAPIHKCRHIIFCDSFLNRHQCCHLEISVIAIKKAFVLQNNYYCSTIAFFHLLEHIENDNQNGYAVYRMLPYIQTHCGLHFSVFHVILLLNDIAVERYCCCCCCYSCWLQRLCMYVCVIFFFFEPQQMANHFLLCSRYHLSFHT